MPRRRAIVYAVLFAAATSLWLYTHGERTQVRRVFADVERLAAKEPGESVMECAAKAKALTDHFKNGCSVVDLSRGLAAPYSHEDIAGGLLAFRSSSTRIAVAFRDLERRIDATRHGRVISVFVWPTGGTLSPRRLLSTREGRAPA